MCTIFDHLHEWKRKDKIKKAQKGLIDLGFVKFKKESEETIYSLKDARKTVIDSF